jgi:hypothetical protein
MVNCFHLVEAHRRRRPPRSPVQASCKRLTIYTPRGGGSLHTSGHEMNLCANKVQKRSVLNATSANAIGMAARRQTVDWSGQPCEARFWERKLGPAKPHYL